LNATIATVESGAFSTQGMAAFTLGINWNGIRSSEKREVATGHMGFG